MVVRLFACLSSDYRSVFVFHLFIYFIMNEQVALRLRRGSLLTHVPPAVMMIVMAVMNLLSLSAATTTIILRSAMISLWNCLWR